MSSTSVNWSCSLAVLPTSTWTTGRSTPTIGGTRSRTRSFRISGRSSAAGMRSRSPVFSSLRLARLVFPSTVSRICKAPMDREGLLSRSLAILRHCPSRTLGMLNPVSSCDSQLMFFQLQPSGSAAVQDERDAGAQVVHRSGRNARLRTGVEASHAL